MRWTLGEGQGGFKPEIMPRCSAWDYLEVRLAKEGALRHINNMKQASKSVSALAYALVLGGLSLAAPTLAATHPLGWGLNADWQASPVPTNAMNDPTAIAAGYNHSLALKDGRAWAWGLNASGQTNVPIAAQSGVSQIAGGGTFSLALKSGGVIAWGSGGVVTNMPTSLTSGVTQVAAGENHALALKTGGVVAWGSNTYGQCDVPDALTNGVSAVSAGGYYSLALKSGGAQVFGIPATNEYSYGIQDVPAEALSGVSAISAGRWHALALKNGGVIAWGAPFYDATNVPAEATSGVTNIAAGDLFSIALKTDGSIVVWGDDTKGQMPIPNFASNGVSQIAAGAGHCLVLSTAMPPRFVDSFVPSAYQNQAYTNSPNPFVRAAGDPAVRYYTSGSWPSWLTLDTNTGELGGTPLELEVNTPFLVVASNSFGRVTNAYQITVLERPQGPPVFLTTNLPNGVVNAPYDQQIVITNGGSFSISDGSLPAGLNMDTNGLISGMPTTAETLQFIVLATNIVGGSNKLFEITIDPPAGAPEFTTTNPLPSGVVGQPYSLQIEVGNYPTSISLLSGALPNGLGLTAAGMVTGTPTQIETGNFTVFATNMVGGTETNYTLQIYGPPVILTTSPLPDGAPGVPYSQQISATGDPIFSLAGGSLPGGLTLATNGLLSGTPSSPGAFNFTVLATNAYGSDTRAYDLLIGALPVFSTTNPLPTGQVGSPYSQQIVASGSPIFSLFAGSLPGGLNLSAAGLVSGTPTAEGAFNFTVRATNDYGWSNRVYDLTILGQLAPAFTDRPRYTNGNVRLAWTNYNASGQIQIWRSTNITRNPPPWSNLGVVTISPWTNVAPPTPSYYRLILVP